MRSAVGAQALTGNRLGEVAVEKAKLCAVSDGPNLKYSANLTSALLYMWLPVVFLSWKMGRSWMAVASDENSTLSVTAKSEPVKIALVFAQLVSGPLIAPAYFFTVDSDSPRSLIQLSKLLMQCPVVFSILYIKQVCRPNFSRQEWA